jgi:hypothetical protein
MKDEFVLRVDWSKATKRGRGRTEGDVTAKGDFMREVVRLLKFAERHLKEANPGWVWGVRKEAERQVAEYLIREGYNKEFVHSLKMGGARRRGKKKGRTEARPVGG